MSIYNIHNSIGLKLLSHWRLGLSQLNKHKFDHDLNLYLILNVHVVYRICTCFLFLSALPSLQRYWFLFELENIDTDILNLSDNKITPTSFYGHSNYDTMQNWAIPKRSKQVDWEHRYFLEILKILDICYFNLRNSGQSKASLLRIPQKCVTPLGNSKAKNQHP